MTQSLQDIPQTRAAVHTTYEHVAVEELAPETLQLSGISIRSSGQDTSISALSPRRVLAKVDAMVPAPNLDPQYMPNMNHIATRGT